MVKNIALLGGTSAIAMTAIERSMGRVMRAPDHPGGDGGAPAPAEAASEAAPAAAPEPAAPPTDDEVAAALEAEFSGDVDPATLDGQTGNEPPVEEGADKAPKGKSAEERIDEITGKHRTAERERDQARDQAEYWRKVASGEIKVPAEAPKSAPQPGDKPDPANYEFGEADTRYITDIAKFEIRQDLAAEQRAQNVQREVQALDNTWNAELAKPELAAKYADFHEKVTKGADEGTWDCTPLMGVAIKASPVGPDVAYYLASNPTESKRIAGMQGLEQALEFGRIEGRFMAERDAAAKPQPNLVSKAPIPPVGRARGAGGQFATQADTDDFAAFERMADASKSKS